MSDSKMTKRAPRPPIECPDTYDGKCFYCTEPIVDTPKNHQHDHFPIPFRLGGDEIICVCESCHQLVDVIALTNWPASTVFEAFDQLWQSPPKARRLFAKLMKVAMDYEKSKDADPDCAAPKETE